MPDRLRLLAAALAVLALAGCGGSTPESTPTPSLAPTSAVPSPTPTASRAAPTPSAPTPSATPTPTRSASPASTADGTYANELSLSEDGALSYVPLRWYAGPDADARCREKGIEPELAWCTDYYYEKAGGRKAAPVSESVSIRLLNDDLKPVEASPTALVEAIADEVWPNYQILVRGGQIVRITQVFTP